MYQQVMLDVNRMLLAELDRQHAIRGPLPRREKKSDERRGFLRRRRTRAIFRPRPAVASAYPQPQECRS
jgi:hypothetical protein